jgi:hypothetical protein
MRSFNGEARTAPVQVDPVDGEERPSAVQERSDDMTFCRSDEQERTAAVQPPSAYGEARTAYRGIDTANGCIDTAYGGIPTACGAACTARGRTPPCARQPSMSPITFPSGSA